MLNHSTYYRRKTILVTGAAGFIGSSVVRALSRFDCSVTCLATGSRHLDLPADGFARLAVRQGDLRSTGIWDELLEGVDIVFHFAAQTSSAYADRHPHEDLEVNLLPVVRLVENCRRTGRRPDVLFSGTVTQTGLTREWPVDERRSDVPVTVYDVNKLAAEKYLQYYARAMGGRSVTLRLANVYGPGAESSRPDRGILNLMVLKALAGEPLVVYGRGEFIRDYIYIDDVVNAFITAGAVMPAVSGKYYVIGSGSGRSIEKMAQTVSDLAAEAVGRRLPVDRAPMPEGLSQIELRHFVADTRSFRKDSGWRPVFPFEEGVRRTIRFFRENIK